MNIASTIVPEEMTGNIVTSMGAVTVSYLIGATHPYERIGKHVLADVYDRCVYSILYDTDFKRRRDYVHIHFNTMRNPRKGGPGLGRRLQ